MLLLKMQGIYWESMGDDRINILTNESLGSILDFYKPNSPFKCYSISTRSPRKSTWRKIETIGKEGTLGSLFII